ncbi:hypothetical protein ASG73_13145 [Janibacter sp. Soil728]|uniref:GNAT family N-acetyltransferase n=1 Tax=Janibacter sp. Soil728 TaxID=1736393 RepID=UPI0006FAE008|nr:GNAT family N-acetyltransferase [Janibacter sp. Soil728]KRE37227.1 hypothetical protein ASG73_13145 [Janibacter sp. Soil728]
MSIEQIPMGALLGWSGDDPVVRAEASPTTPLPALGLRRGPDVAFVFLRPTHVHGISLMLRGDDALLHELVTAPPFATWLTQARTKGADGVTLPRTAEGLRWLLPEVRGRWEFLSTTHAPDVVAPVGTVELDAGRGEEIQALLDQNNPDTDGQPFARPGQRWVGVRDGSGTLLGVGCCELETSGAPVLAGITVVAAARGLGLGRGITAELTRRAVADHGWCTLGMYSHNDRARGIYRSLGYVVQAEWSSGRLG